MATWSLIFEFGAIAGVVRSIRPWVLLVGPFFHIGTGLVMGIWFFPFLGVYLLFVPWSRLLTVGRGKKR